MDKNILLQTALEKSSKAVALIGSIILLLGIIVIVNLVSVGCYRDNEKDQLLKIAKKESYKTRK